jgi:probable rRNA maturation factor
VTAADPGEGPLDLTFTLVTEIEFPGEITAESLEALSLRVLSAEGASGCWEVAVALVGDERLQALHRDFMGIDAPTDVMTFPTDEGSEECRGGDLVISVDHARTQAGAWGLSPADEIRFLVVHGLLHLLGWRDDSAGKRDRMLARQQALFDSWRNEGGES